MLAFLTMRMQRAEPVLPSWDHCQKPLLTPMQSLIVPFWLHKCIMHTVTALAVNRLLERLLAEVNLVLLICVRSSANLEKKSHASLCRCPDPA